MSTIHLVSHTHWDREWYLTFQQFRLKLVHLIDSLLDILENDPEYDYYLLDGQAILLEDYLQIRPNREGDLVRFIKNGRLLIGPWYISPDEFLLSPESHVRNLLEGNRLCLKYGAKMSVGYLPDTFGHIGQMPQILQGFRIDSACMWRGISDQPLELDWRSPDGSSVLLSYLRESYGNAANLSTDDPARFINEVQELNASLLPFSITGQILLMHGIDHMEPSKNLSSAIHAYHQQSLKDELRFSSLPLYFDALRSCISASGIKPSIISGELRSPKSAPLLPNVLSTRIWLKQYNYACENELTKWVEPLSVWAYLLDSFSSGQLSDHSNNNHPYLSDQQAAIRSAWKLLMHCHPHDSICGTSIDQVNKEMQVRFDQVDQISQELIAQNLQRICNHVNTTFPHLAGDKNRGQDILSAILVFNPNDQPQSGLIDLNITLADHYSSFNIINDHNADIPYHQKGSGLTELISITLDKKGLKQGLGMVHDGIIDGMAIRDFNIEIEENKVIIRATISDRGLVEHNKWKQGLARLDELFANPSITEFVVHAYSDPEVDLSFIARDIPGHSYCCYWIRGFIEPISKARPPMKISPVLQAFLPVFQLATRIPLLPDLFVGRKHRVENRPPKIENEYFVVDAAGTDGTLSITDKRTNQVYQGLNRFVDGGDCGDLYNYCPPLHDQLVPSRLTKIHCEETEVSRKLIINYELSLPKTLSPDRKSRSHERIVHKIISTVTLVPGVPHIDIHTEIDNKASDHRLRVHFPAPFSCSTAFHDGQYELVERSIELPEYDDTWVEQPRPEVPQLRFTMVTDDKTSLTIANRGLPEVEVRKTKNGKVEIALTLLRCVGWLSRDDLISRKGHAGPMAIPTPDAQMIGKHEFDYSIIPGDKNKQASIHQAYAFSSPLRSVSTAVHPGELPIDQSLISNSNPNFIITAIKSGEEKPGVIVRGFNLLSAPIEVTLRPFRAFKHAIRVNLAEEPIESLSISPQGQVTLRVEAYKIVTINFL
jgi:mannosylglycerate hydrolase